MTEIQPFFGIHLCLAFSKTEAVVRPATLLKKRPWHRCFPANFTKFVRTTFFIEHLRWQFSAKTKKKTH